MRILKIATIGFLLGVFPTAWAEPSLQSILAPLDWPQSPQSPAVATGNKPEQAKPEKSFVSITLNEVLEELNAILSTTLDEGEQLILSSTSSWEDVPVEEKAGWQLIVENAFSPDVRGRWYAHLRIESKGGLLAARQIKVNAALFRDLLLVQKRLERGDSPARHEGGLRSVSRNIYLERGNPVPEGANLSRYELIRSVPEGRLLDWNDLERRPAVRRGETVDVTVRQGLMTVTVRARSLEDGLLGDSVAVRNLSSQRELTATVIGDDQVEIEL